MEPFQKLHVLEANCSLEKFIQVLKLIANFTYFFIRYLKLYANVQIVNNDVIMSFHMF